VIEVAYSSLSKDRNIKAPLYAASGFHEYWVVNVLEQVVEVFRDPLQNGYRERTRHGIEETIALLDFPDVKVQIAKLF
jgi:Uma2 family endonuclease